MSRSLASRLWLAFSLCTLVVLGVATAMRVVAEHEVVASTMIRDRRFFGESWLALLAHAPPEQVDEMVTALASDPMVRSEHIQVEVDTAEAGHERARAMPLHQRERLAHGRVAAAVVDGRLRTLIPVTGARDLLIELDEPLAIREDLATMHQATAAGSSAAILVISALVLWLLVRRLVGRPLELLGAHARRVGGGDLEMRLEPPDTTELGLLADEMNAMTDQLSSARAALSRLEMDRSSLLESLRHADRLRTAGQLSAALAHEIGTPLNVVIGRAQLIERDPGGESTRDNASVIVREGKRIADLVRRLLGFVRRSPDASVPGESVEATVARTLDVVAPMARRRDIALVTSLRDGAADAPLLRPDEVVQVLTNLVVNAVQASPDGARIELEARPELREGRRGIQLAVVDHGVGIDEATLPHVFEPFFTTKPGDQGTGLGLSVVRGIVDERRGALEVRATPGGGATFEVWLPTVAAATRAALTS